MKFEPCINKGCAHFRQYEYVDGMLYFEPKMPPKVDTQILEDWKIRIGRSPMLGGLSSAICPMCSHFKAQDLCTDELARKKSPAKRGRKPGQPGRVSGHGRGDGADKGLN